MKLRKCPIEYALYLGDDHYYPISGVVPYITIGNMMHLSNGENLPDEALTPLNERFSSYFGKNILFGGGTGWEGDGFLAFANKVKTELLWLFHFPQSEAFVSAKIENDKVIAISEEYPNRFIFYIAIEDPKIIDIKVQEA
ncbi:MAG: hypothetical protein GX654_13435 [Desulfatiglans sp.]|nr:hypothetical protein [Desulfatiglans sp.]